MKILQKNAGALTNAEVLEFFRARGASTDRTRVFAPIAPSEFLVHDYLVQTAACNQTKENINEFLRRCDIYDLAKAEKLNIVNIRPSSLVEIDPLIEECENRMSSEAVEELVNLTVEVLPPPPGKPEETAEETNKAVSNQEPMETS